MSVRAAASALRRAKAPGKPNGPTVAQADALWALMKAAHTEGELWKWSLSADSGLVRCERWRGLKCVAIASYAPEEVERLGEGWPAHVMQILGDPWQESFGKGGR